MTHYVDSVLQPGETVRYRGDIHWKVYLPGIVLVIIGLFFLFAAPQSTFGAFMTKVVGLVLLVPGIAWAAWAWFLRWTTEIAVTDKRIIFKSGFIQRHTVEMHMDKVESVDVDQSILGRIFNYGDITVRGTGATLEPFRSIGAPLDFRNHVSAG
ncbi:MAG: PH domain-containing protein [Alphaproteobacteria bacterium]|nr:PH domain-containing protein [Alphaproteobacteria bacterium]